MNRILLLLGTLFIPFTLFGQVYKPLPLDPSRSFEARGAQKEIRKSRLVWIGNSMDGWTHAGEGSLTFVPDFMSLDQGSLLLKFPSSTGKRAQGSSSDPDYATYGKASMIYSLQGSGEDWRPYNRIAFWINPQCDSVDVVNMDLTLYNKGIPAVSHLINLQNHTWNACYLDLDELDRNQITAIGFSATLRGSGVPRIREYNYYVGKIELQQVADPEPIWGWVPKLNKIVYSTSGYMREGTKTALAAKGLKGRHFALVSDKGTIVYENRIKKTRTSLGSFDVLDFTDYKTPGVYKLRVRGVESNPFHIDDYLWEPSVWKVLNFIYCQRCGSEVPGIHGICHSDVFSEHNGRTIPYSGGWHDAGDLSQQTLQTADVAYALLEAAKAVRNRNATLSARLEEESCWGLEFVLKNRYGDGYRASSMGLIHWTDGVVGSQDDIYSVRVQNLSFDNFLYAAYEAYAAMNLETNGDLIKRLEQAAIADFDFALQRHNEVGYGEVYHFYEHMYNTSESQYMATISWAASQLYQLTKLPKYATLAATFIDYPLACQETESKTINGFFYRDTTRRSIVHFVHQSRDQIYIQALTLLCKTQPTHQKATAWRCAIARYGDYIKDIMTYTAPYGMIPSGVYKIDEYQDTTSFYRLHLFPPEDASEQYVTQVQRGVRLDDQFYVKRFPVWFSIFNGNSAVHLATGKAASLCGIFLDDEQLKQIGREQLYWTVGKNPFGQSLIYGEGYDYPQMDSFSSGEITGEMPVGIRSWGNEDIPYWPRTNNACYKEVWVTTAGKWLSLIADYFY